MKTTLLALMLGSVVLIVPAGAHATIVTGGGVEGFYTSDDGNNHAIIGETSGTVYEAYWSTGGAASVASLHTFSANTIVSVAGYFTAGDGYRHAIVALTNGTVNEIYYKPSVGINMDTLTTFTSGTIKDIAGCVHSYDGSQNVYVLTTSGYVYDVRWISGQGVNVTNIGYTGNTGLVACYDNANTSTQYVITEGNTSGNPFGQISWSTFGTFSNTTISGTPNSTIGLGAYPVSGSGYLWDHNIVWGSGSVLKEYILGSVYNIWTFAQGINAVGGFGQPTAGNSYQHVLTYTSNGSLYDMYTNSGTWTYDYLGAF